MIPSKPLLGPLLIQNETSEKVASSLRRNKNGKSLFPFQTLWLPLPLLAVSTEKQNWFWLWTVSWLNPTDLYEFNVFLVFKVKYCNMQLPLPGISHPFVLTHRAPRQPKFGLKTEIPIFARNPWARQRGGRRNALINTWFCWWSFQQRRSTILIYEFTGSHLRVSTQEFKNKTKV